MDRKKNNDLHNFNIQSHIFLSFVSSTHNKETVCVCQRERAGEDSYKESVGKLWSTLSGLGLSPIRFRPLYVNMKKVWVK